MSKVPELEDVLEAGNDFKKMRATIIEKRQAGVPVEDLAETVIAATKERIEVGDLTGADALLFHAVHSGVRPSLLFAECHKLPKEA
jgi:hypothetical protein